MCECISGLLLTHRCAPSHRKYHRVCPPAAFFPSHLSLRRWSPAVLGSTRLYLRFLSWSFPPLLLFIFFCFFDLISRCIPFISSTSIPLFSPLWISTLSSFTVSIIFIYIFTGKSYELDKPYQNSTFMTVLKFNEWVNGWITEWIILWIKLQAVTPMVSECLWILAYLFFT